MTPSTLPCPIPTHSTHASTFFLPLPICPCLPLTAFSPQTTSRCHAQAHTITCMENQTSTKVEVEVGAGMGAEMRVGVGVDVDATTEEAILAAKSFQLSVLSSQLPAPSSQLPALSCQMSTDTSCCETGAVATLITVE
ncbi:hypothetical protein TcWFU_009840 [Taenia crassiceps]|uniref:Uncharacterized protein n=1 Tax=Taenia crassiceps TaxID=6207 RepID=A0ABR4QC59_9CEST